MVCNVLLVLLYLSSGGNERDNEFQTFLEFNGVGDYEENESFGAFGQAKSDRCLSCFDYSENQRGILTGRHLVRKRLLLAESGQ